MTINSDDFRSAMRHLAGHVCLITTKAADENRNGLTATAVCSVSAEPPTLLCSVYTQTACHDTIQESGKFAINILAHTDKYLADRFAGKIRGEERFQSGNWETLKTGAPILETALASFDCELVKTVQMNTHSILFGEIKAVKSIGSNLKPLLYAHGDYGNFSKRGAGMASGMQWFPDWDYTDENL
jgi:flavin reductase (NADH)/flavin reductase